MEFHALHPNLPRYLGNGRSDELAILTGVFRLGEEHQDLTETSETGKFQNGRDAMLGRHWKLLGREGGQAFEGSFQNYPKTGLEEELFGPETVRTQAHQHAQETTESDVVQTVKSGGSEGAGAAETPEKTSNW